MKLLKVLIASVIVLSTLFISSCETTESIDDLVITPELDQTAPTNGGGQSGGGGGTYPN